MGLKETRVIDVGFDDVGLVVDIAPTLASSPMLDLWGDLPWYDRTYDRHWRYLDVAGMRLHLRYDTRRVKCPTYGVKVERVPWAETSVWFTRPLEDHVASLAQRCDQTSGSGGRDVRALRRSSGSRPPSANTPTASSPT
jgi:hypothetical protein